MYLSASARVGYYSDFLIEVGKREKPEKIIGRRNAVGSSKQKQQQMWAKIYVDSPIGYWEIQGSELGISRIQRVDKPLSGSGEEMPEIMREAAAQLRAYFEGSLRQFNLKLDFGAAPAFYRAVWEVLLRVPYGHTTSYLAIAEALNNPAAVRAVGQANAHNPIAIVVPCHRCIARSGDLQGYFYGLDVKRALLELENPRSFARQGSLFLEE